MDEEEFKRIKEEIDARPTYYYRNGKPIEEPDAVLKWAKEWENKRVCQTNFKWGGSLSTVYLGIDHSFFKGPPLIFETMIFCDDEELNGECWRYSTEKEAIKNHAKLVRKYRDYKPKTKK